MIVAQHTLLSDGMTLTDAEDPLLDGGGSSSLELGPGRGLSDLLAELASAASR